MNWAIYYRPNSINECILPDNVFNKLKAYVDSGELPDLILDGPAGVGKTSAAIAMCKDLDCDYYKINASLEKGIDTIKDKVMQFASTVSFKDGKKYIIFDEADGMLHSAQDGLRAFIEEFNLNCGYIFTVNNSSRIIPAIKSRCETIEFTYTRSDFPTLAKKFYERIEMILKKNGVEYEKAAVAVLIKKFYPDWRHVLIMLQNYSKEHKKIDSGILANRDSESYKELIGFIKGKRWSDIRRWVGENSNVSIDFTSFSRKLHSELETLTEPNCWPDIVLNINEFDYRNYFTLDKEVNVVAFLTRLMQVCIWK